MFRGDNLDVQDSITMIKTESMDLKKLAERYKETADYYYNSAACKTNLRYLISALDEAGLSSIPLKELYESWNP